MKAPDKIKVNVPNKNVNQEYIRKEALIEWLKSNISNITGINDVEGNYEAGQADAFWEVIEHINEM